MAHYEIKIEGLKYGKIRKEFEAEYKQALTAYNDIQKTFKNVPCEIILNRINIKDTGKKERKLEYKNYLGKDYVVENKLNDLLKVLSDIKDLKLYHANKMAEGNDDFLKIRHAIELGAANELSPEDCKTVFNNLNDKAAIRRSSKLEYQKLKACTDALNVIATQITKCLNECMKIDKNMSTEKAKFNAELADEEYIKTLTDYCKIGGDD